MILMIESDDCDHDDDDKEHGSDNENYPDEYWDHDEDDKKNDNDDENEDIVDADHENPSALLPLEGEGEAGGVNRTMHLCHHHCHLRFYHR